jgi:hypothetical protein
MTSSCKKGKAAEYVFVARCMLAGLDCFTTVAEDSRADLVVNGKRVQVKKMTPENTLNIRKVGCNSKTNTKIYNYTKADIDYFAAVDLSTFEVFVVSMEQAAGYTRSISRSALETLAKVNDVSVLGV